MMLERGGTAVRAADKQARIDARWLRTAAAVFSFTLAAGYTVGCSHHIIRCFDRPAGELTRIVGFMPLSASLKRKDTIVHTGYLSPCRPWQGLFPYGSVTDPVDSGIEVITHGVAVRPLGAEWLYGLVANVLITNDNDGAVELDTRSFEFTPLELLAHTQGFVPLCDAGAPAKKQGFTLVLEKGTPAVPMVYEPSSGEAPVLTVPAHDRAIVGAKFDCDFVKKGQLDFTLKRTDTGEVYIYRFIFAEE